MSAATLAVERLKICLVDKPAIVEELIAAKVAVLIALSVAVPNPAIWAEVSAVISSEDKAPTLAVVKPAIWVELNAAICAVVRALTLAVDIPKICLADRPAIWTVVNAIISSVEKLSNADALNLLSWVELNPAICVEPRACALATVKATICLVERPAIVVELIAAIFSVPNAFN